jgi:hypothetical protein
VCKATLAVARRCAALTRAARSLQEATTGAPDDASTATRHQSQDDAAVDKRRGSAHSLGIPACANSAKAVSNRRECVCSWHSLWG